MLLTGPSLGMELFHGDETGKSLFSLDHDTMADCGTASDLHPIGLLHLESTTSRLVISALHRLKLASIAESPRVPPDHLILLIRKDFPVLKNTNSAGQNQQI